MKATEKTVLLVLALCLLCGCGEMPKTPSKAPLQQEAVHTENEQPPVVLEEVPASDAPVAEEAPKEELPRSFPNPTAQALGLTGQDAILFDAAVAALDRTPNSDIFIPVIGVYGSYEEDGSTVVVCSVQCHYYYGYTGPGCAMDEGGMHRVGKAILQKGEDGEPVCTSFIFSHDGGVNQWVDDFCGPLTELKAHFMEGTSWEVTTTMPPAEELLDRYLANLEQT